MKTNTNGYCRYQFPREIIVSYKTLRQWSQKFGPEHARNLSTRQGGLGDVLATGRGVREDQG
jgi:hypothetical protein